jgi:trigger factor
MKISSQETAGGTRQVILEITRDDYQKNIENDLKKLRQKVNMPGFRKGKVPLSLLRKQYGKSLKIEKINELIQENLDKFVKDNNLDLIGNFIPAENQKTYTFDEDDFRFTFDYHEMPSAEIDWKKLKKVPYYKIVPSDEDVEKEVERYITENAEWEQKDEVTDETVEIITPLIPGLEQPPVVYPADFKDKTYKKFTREKKKDDTFKISVKQLRDLFRLTPDIEEAIEKPD